MPERQAMCSSRKYPNPPPLRKGFFSTPLEIPIKLHTFFLQCVWSYKAPHPPPQEIPIPSVGGVYGYFLDLHYH